MTPTPAAELAQARTNRAEPVAPASRHRALGMLLSAVLLSAVLGALLFWAVLKGEWMTDAFAAAARWMVDYPVWAVAAGLSPLVATLLVGYGYAERAIRRRA